MTSILFTKRHYEFLAQFCRNQELPAHIVDALAAELQEDNHNFQTDRFRRACGLSAELPSHQRTCDENWRCTLCGQPAQTHWDHETCWTCGYTKRFGHPPKESPQRVAEHRTAAALARKQSA